MAKHDTSPGEIPPEGTASESGAGGLNLSFGDQDIDSLTTTLGVMGSKAFSTGFGILVPTIWGEWIHEFMNNNDGSSVRYLNDPTGLSTFTAANESPDRDYFQVGAGLVAVLPGGWSPFANCCSCAMALRSIPSRQRSCLKTASSTRRQVASI